MIRRVTSGPKHHLFGFHDLLAFNPNNDKLLSLEVETINRPPLPQEKCSLGYVDLYNNEFIKLGETNAFNYPQGARQQWLDNDTFIVNNQIGNHWGSEIYDVNSKSLVSQLDATCHCISKDGKFAYGINYSRLHRLGGYGYIGIDDKTKSDETPSNDGIYITDVSNNTSRLLLSIKEVSECSIESSVHNGFHHYITHLVLSPDNKRIAFLHRFFLPDGGLRTRLMTVGTDGGNLRCLGYGFLSHFDWKDNNSIFIWGRTGSSIDAIRSNKILSNPIISPMLKGAKKIVRTFLKGTKGMSMSFLIITDAEKPEIKPVAQGIINSDGHPMFSPINRNLIICDTYPDKEESRYLFLYNFENNKRINIGYFKRLLELPDISLNNKYTQGVDKRILNLMSPELFSYTRSGLHCDLHPRWNCDGTMVAFDSIHEGTRQIYTASVKDYEL